MKILSLVFYIFNMKFSMSCEGLKLTSNMIAHVTGTHIHASFQTYLGSLFCTIIDQND